MKPPQDRVRAWLRWEDLTLAAGAERVGCSRTLLSLIVNGHRLPGRRVANQIERQSAPWPKGPIRAAEWDQVAT